MSETKARAPSPGPLTRSEVYATMTTYFEGRRMAKMTPEEREHIDARADKEAWSYALSILSPWVEATRLIGSDELTRVMENALAEAEKRSPAPSSCSRPWSAQRTSPVSKRAGTRDSRLRPLLV